MEQSLKKNQGKDQKRIITSDRGIQSIKPDGHRHRYTVNLSSMAAGGLQLRVNPAGQKTFYSRMRLAGKQIEVRLGNYPALSLKGSVEQHNYAVGLAEQGIDPRLHKAEQKIKQETELTLSDLIERWLEQVTANAEVTLKTIKAHRWRWNKYLNDHIGKMKVTRVERQHLAAAVDKARSQSKEEARKCLSTLNGALDYALARGLIDSNPARLLRPKDFAASPNKPRERWLSLNELHQFWLALDSPSYKTSPQMRALLKVICFTGCRRAEASGMQWQELDLEAGTWDLPKERSKNGYAHRFFIHPEAVKILQQLQLTNSPFVFESPSSADKPISPDAVTRALARITKKMSIPHFNVHDLRRTTSTHWADTLEADSALVDLMQNHLPANKLIRTYQKGKRYEQQKKVWFRWGDLLLDTVSQSNCTVVPFAKGL